jgi:hypothetical protein
MKYWGAIFGRPFLMSELTLFNYFVKIIYRSHLEITSIVGTPPLPSTPCDHPTLFTQVRGRCILGSWEHRGGPGLLY